MWIKHDRFHDDGRLVVKAIKLPEMDEKVRFSSNGTAQVSADVGELLTDRVDSIVENEEKADAEEEADEEADTEEAFSIDEY